MAKGLFEDVQGTAMHTQVKLDDFFENGGVKIIIKHVNTEIKLHFTREGLKENSQKTWINLFFFLLLIISSL